MTIDREISLTTWFITGCSRGLGLGLVRTLAKDARNVVIATCRDPDSAQDLKSIAKGSAGRIYLVRLDVGDEVSIKEAAAEAEQILGEKGLKLGLDYLLNNAGIALLDPIFSFNIENFNKIMHTNVAGPALVSTALLPLLRMSQRRVIMNMSSTMGSIASDNGPKAAIYSISKSALNMVTYKQAKEAPDLIVISMCPGWVKTELGGPEAFFEVDDTIPHVVEVVKKLKAEDSGAFFNYQGQRVPW